MKHLILLCAIALTATADAFTWTGPTVVRQDARYSITVSMASSGLAMESAGAQFTAVIPDNTTLIATTTLAAATASSKGVRCQQTANRIECVVYGLNVFAINSGQIVLLTFVTTAAPGPITFTMPRALGVDMTGKPAVVSPASPLGQTILARCDFNDDNVIAKTDVDAFADQIIQRTAQTRCDLDGTASCTIEDLFLVINAALGNGCAATSRGQGSDL